MKHFESLRKSSVVILYLMLAMACAAGWPDAAMCQVAINEVLYTHGNVGSGFEAHNHEWIEIYNSGPNGVDLTGWTISNRNGEPNIVLPSWVLPAGCYLTLHQEVGTDDANFADIDGHYYTGDANEVFGNNEDECALYSGTPGTTNIVDFIAWNSSGSYSPGTAHNYAVAKGIWTNADYLDTQGLYFADTIARYFDGYDRDASDDWQILSWSIYAHKWAHKPENPIQESPQNVGISDDNTPTFDWSAFADAGSYDLQVDNDCNFSSPVINLTGLPVSEYTPASPLSDNDYFWRVRANVSGAPTPWSAGWLLIIQTAPLGPSSVGTRSVCQHLYQRKDTKLLCIWYDDKPDTRPGCPENGNYAWDKPHPDAPPPAPKVQRVHGTMYCVPTSIAMINHFYGGNLNIDRVSYQMNHNLHSGPEGDLGHDDGYAPPPSSEEPDGLSWALNGAAITVVADPNFDQIKGWVDTLDCFMARIPGHMMVIDNYWEWTTPSGSDCQVVYAQEPWRGPNYRYVYKYIIGGKPKKHWAKRYSKSKFAHAFIQPSSGVTARMQEASVTTDSDKDGVMDFDEIERFKTDKDKPDTDKDEVRDRLEIRSYTFHTHCNNNALDFPDIDKDGDRAEVDCDSDNDSDFDGGEDIDGDGKNPEAGETCMFDAGAWDLVAKVDKSVYGVHEDVHIIDSTQTFHKDSKYYYELDKGCPDKEDDSPLEHKGWFMTDSEGHAIKKKVHNCPTAGEWYLTVDVLRDKKYSEPDNTDPQICWVCEHCTYTSCEERPLDDTMHLPWWQPVTISWTPARWAGWHDIYFGTNFYDVNDANNSWPVGGPNDPHVYKGIQPLDHNNYGPLNLELGTTYYWRIDEVNDSCAPGLWKGDVWNFTTADFVAVDDFEEYTYDANLRDTWVDQNGTGSFIQLETGIVHTGLQSMKYQFDNSEWPAYSEVVRTFVPPQDWTRYDFKALTLYFYGDPNNDVEETEQMYVALKDTHANVGVLPYEGDPNNVRCSDWSEWNINLQDPCLVAADVNVASIRKIYIGFGDSSSTQYGGDGIVYFDDIRLYPSRCVTEHRPAGDVTGDCAADLADLGRMANDWLDSDYTVDVVTPDPCGLVGHWKLDGNANDSGGGNDGEVYGNPTYGSGVFGQAVILDGDDYVSIPPLNLYTDTVTVSTWIKRDGYQENWPGVVYSQDANTVAGLNFNDNENEIGYTYNDDVNTLNWSSGLVVPDGEWAFAALIVEPTKAVIYVYDGKKINSATNEINHNIEEFDGVIDIGRDALGAYFKGALDDVRIYDYPLSEAEIASLVTGDTGYMPLTSPANLYDEEMPDYKVVDFKDYVILSSMWLEVQLWPPDE